MVKVGPSLRGWMMECRYRVDKDKMKHRAEPIQACFRMNRLSVVSVYTSDYTIY